VSERWDLDNGVGGAAGYGNDPWAAHRTGARPVDPFAVGSPDDPADITVGGGPAVGAPAVGGLSVDGPQSRPAAGPTGGYLAAGYGGDGFSVGDGHYPAVSRPAPAEPTVAAPPPSPWAASQPVAGSAYSDTTAAFFGAASEPGPTYQAPTVSGYGVDAGLVVADPYNPYAGGPTVTDGAFSDGATGYHDATAFIGGPYEPPGLPPAPAAGAAASQPGYHEAAQPAGYQDAVSLAGYQASADYPPAAAPAGYRESPHQTGYQVAAQQTGYQDAAQPAGYQAAAHQTGYQQVVGYPDAYQQPAQPTTYQAATDGYGYPTGYQQSVGVDPSTGTFVATGYQQAGPGGDQSGHQTVRPTASQPAIVAQVPAQPAAPGYPAAHYTTEPYLADPYPQTGGLARPREPAAPASPDGVYAGHQEAGYPPAAQATGYDVGARAAAFGDTVAGSGIGVVGGTDAAGTAAQPADYLTGGQQQRQAAGYPGPTARYSDGSRQAGTGPRRQAEAPGTGPVPPSRPAPPLPGEAGPRQGRRARRGGGDRLTEALNFRIDPPEDLYAPADGDVPDGRRGRRAAQDDFLEDEFDQLDDLDSFDDDLDEDDPDDDRGVGRRRRFEPAPRRGDQGDRARRRRAAPKLVAMLLVLAVLLGGGIYAGGRVLGRLTGSSSAPDFPGPGLGSVNVKVIQGATATDIAKSLFDAGVIKSERAFITAAANDPNSRKIQPGTFRLKTQMSAKEALAALLDNANSIYKFTLVPGRTADFLITELADRLGVPKQTYQDLIDHPAGKLDLPSYASGRVEGYLFPGTYDLDPKATPAQTLNMFIDAFNTQAKQINLETLAQQNGMTPGQIVTIASIIQMEVPRMDDGQRVSRVIYNRLADKTGRYQKLDMDSTTRYAVQKFTGPLSQKDLTNPSPYNTRLHTGLPPGAIASPELWALTSALHPYAGPQGGDGQPWYYFVALPKSKITIFASESEWPAAQARFKAEGGVG